MGSFLFLIFAGLAFAAYKLFGSYNSAQELGQKIKESKSNILVMLKKRKLLIERLAEVVKAYAGHEKDILLSVSQDQVGGEANLAKDYRETTALFANLQMMAQRFPTIKADTQYSRHMDDISSIENELQGKREGYNRYAQEYNSAKRKIPFVFFAKTLGFEDAPFLEFDDSESLDQISDFKTDEGEGITKLLGNGSDAIRSAATSVSHRALEAGRVARGKVNEVADAAKAKMTKTKYRYSTKGVVSEPVSFVELKELHEKGEITEKTNVISVNEKAWKKFAELLVIENSASALPPPPADEE